MSTMVSVRQVTNPNPEELDKAGEVAAAAFKSDDFIESCVGGNHDFEILFHRMTIAAAAVTGEFYVASYGEHDFAGVAAWFGPGRELLDSPDQAEAGFNELMSRFPPGLKKWWMEYFLPRYTKMTTLALGEGTKRAAWHLQLIAVLPKYQGNGIAGQLIKHMESKVIQQGKAFCLETQSEKNVELYKHLGYSVKGREEYESSTGGFHMYTMFKEAKVL